MLIFHQLKAGPVRNDWSAIPRLLWIRPGSHMCSASHVEEGCTLLGSAPNLHFTEETLPNSIWQQPRISGNRSGWRMDGVFSKWQEVAIGKEGEGSTLCYFVQKKGHQTVNCHAFCSSQVHSGWAFLEEQTPGSFLEALERMVDVEIWSRRFQTEVRGTSPRICRRKDKASQRQISLGNTGLLLV